MNLIQTRASHWYQVEGGVITPAYEVPNKSKPGTMRSTTLRDARTLGLVPSVTNILGVLNKPALNNWRVTQGILSALTLPRIAGEGEEAFAERVVADLDAESSAARDLGTDIHDALEMWLTTQQLPTTVPAYEYVVPTALWLTDNVKTVHRTEFYVAGFGFAGRVDLDCTLNTGQRVVVDFKSQKVRNGKPVFYDEFPLQLAAYRMGMFDGMHNWEPPGLMSVIIDSITPGPPHVKIWEEGGTHAPGYAALFEHCFNLWCYVKNYAPYKL